MELEDITEERLHDEVERLSERVELLEGLLREADKMVVWETAMPSGRSFQERVETALQRRS